MKVLRRSAVFLTVLVGLGLATLGAWRPEVGVVLGRVLPPGMALAGALGAWRRGWRALALELGAVALTLLAAPAAGRRAAEAVWRAWGVGWAALGAFPP